MDEKEVFVPRRSAAELPAVESINNREGFETLLEANGSLRAVTAAHRHDLAAQCLGIPPQGASECDWSIGGQNPKSWR